MARVTASSSVTSATVESAFASPSSSTAAASLASSRPTRWTRAPSVTNRRAVASPMPLSPPVMSATLSASRAMDTPSIGVSITPRPRQTGRVTINPDGDRAARQARDALEGLSLLAQRWHELLGLLRLDARWFAWRQVLNAEEALMAIVAGVDVHRRQITFDALDTETGAERGMDRCHAGGDRPLEPPRPQACVKRPLVTYLDPTPTTALLLRHWERRLLLPNTTRRAPARGALPLPLDPALSPAVQLTPADEER